MVEQGEEEGQRSAIGVRKVSGIGQQSLQSGGGVRLDQR
jgi:hypothetical protein